MAHAPQIIIDLALILVSAGVITVLFKKLKQPVVLGYIVAGFLVGPNNSLFPTIGDNENIAIWAEIGIIFLLFSLGLEFSFKKLLKSGGSSSITGIIEIGGMMLVGYLTGYLLGWKNIDSIFLGGIIAISSTTIILRAIDELGLKSQKFVTHVFGVLIIEDVVAVLLLVLLSTVAVSQQFAGAEMFFSVSKLAFFLLLWFLLGIFILPSVLKKAKQFLNEETMLVIAIGLCFLMVVLATGAGFSAALGAFIMGSILAETVHAETIEHIIKPVKNLFGAIFFVSVGMLINPVLLGEYIVPVFVLSLVVIFGKSVLISVGSIVSGQPLKQATQAGMAMSQIGEFSFIIATLGQTLKVTSDFLYPIAVGVSVLTTFTTPYLIQFNTPVNNWLEKHLPERWQASLNRYSNSAQRISESGQWRQLFNSYGIAVAVNSVLLLFVVVFSTQVLQPLILEQVQHVFTTKLIIALAAITLMAPFLWALAFKKINKTATSSLWLSSKYNRGPLFVLMAIRVLLAVFFIGFLLNNLFSPVVALIGAIVIAIATYFLFYKRLQDWYMRIENRFMSNLNAREIEQTKKQSVLTPWDAHITYYDVSPHSKMVGKSLEKTSIRERFGVNIAVIERGNQIIHAPTKEQVIYPHDKIGVIGTDEQLTVFAGFVQTQQDETNFLKKEDDMVLQSITAEKVPFTINKAIKDSEIREKTEGLVVGIERDGKRILNPASSETILPNDILWIVGSKRCIKQLIGIPAKQK